MFQLWRKTVKEEIMERNVEQLKVQLQREAESRKAEFESLIERQENGTEFNSLTFLNQNLDRF